MSGEERLAQQAKQIFVEALQLDIVAGEIGEDELLVQLVFDTDPDWLPLDFFSPYGYAEADFVASLFDTQWFSRNLVDHSAQGFVEFTKERIDQDYWITRG